MQQRLGGRVDGALQTTGHAHEAQHVHRHEGHVEADEPAPERALAPELIEAEAEHLRPPVGDAGEHAEHHAADDDVMEVRDQEQAVVQHEVRARHGQQHAGHAADGERHHEADRPQRGGVVADAAAEHTFTLAPEPMVKKWCSQTMNDRMPIASVAPTIDL
ncbi:hypothetical protein G6F63_014301 [Rhizopus arrhizus]|nr:hypothetical protein G6F63_014301 [Rhizopus arrhizus]